MSNGQLPDYISSAKPNPTESRAPWFKNTAPAYAGIFLSVPFMAGMAGAHLALAYAGTFTENMSAGRGFIAIAVVVLGRWNPLLVLVAALLFGAASAFQEYC